MFLLKTFLLVQKKKKFSVKSTHHFLYVHEHEVSQRWLRNSKILKNICLLGFHCCFLGPCGK